MIPGPRIQTDAGPVALAVGNLLGGSQTDLAVANSGADNVQIFPGVGGGFFNDQTQATKTYAVGQAPSSLFLGNFNGLGQGLATLNAGSNDGTLITGLGSANPRDPDLPDRRRLADIRLRGRLHRQWVHRPGGGQQRRRPSGAACWAGPAGCRSLRP